MAESSRLVLPRSGIQWPSASAGAADAERTPQLLLAELWTHTRRRRRYWLLPLLLPLMAIGGLIALAGRR
jgi:hypothetical protein